MSQYFYTHIDELRPETLINFKVLNPSTYIMLGLIMERTKIFFYFAADKNDSVFVNQFYKSIMIHRSSEPKRLKDCTFFHRNPIFL